MGKEYKIRFQVPSGYSPQNLFTKIPSPIHRRTMTEIYNYRIENDGFYFSDSLVDSKVASIAFRLFIDEALTQSETIEIVEL